MFTQGPSGNVKGTAPGKAKTHEEKFPHVKKGDTHVPQSAKWDTLCNVTQADLKIFSIAPCKYMTRVL